MKCEPFCIGIGGPAGSGPDRLLGGLVRSAAGMFAQGMNVIRGALDWIPGVGAGTAISEGDVRGALVAGGLDVIPGGRLLSRGAGVLPAKQAAQLADFVGFSRRARDAPFDSHGQAVFTNGRSFITPDVDSHNGGVWKMFDRRGNQVGTFDALLTRIKD